MQSAEIKYLQPYESDPKKGSQCFHSRGRIALKLVQHLVWFGMHKHEVLKVMRLEPLGKARFLARIETSGRSRLLKMSD
jgi:hypothetical protein